MACSGNNVGSISGTFTLSQDVDAGSTVVIYLIPNNGSNATPAENVADNYTTVAVHDAGTYSYTVNVTSAFTESSGGVLAVFAVNFDGTAISSSKSNSLNCTEAISTPTPTLEPTPTPTLEPTPTPTLEPTPTPTLEPTPT
ncbi:MAG TPA: hypothetical protein VGK63_00855, partial [Candidatus Limnocylindrales bacterium]